MVAALFLLSLVLLLYLSPSESSVGNLSEFGRLYELCGVLVPIKTLRSGCIYRFLDDTGSIKAISFFGQCVQGYSCIYARLEEYRGEKELVILHYG